MQIPKADYLRIKVIPRSPKTEITDIFEDATGEQTIKIRLKALPEKGKANIELIKFLSKELGINRDQVTIISGKQDQLKLIKVKWT